MKSTLFLAGVAIAMAGCAAGGQTTAWGKPGVSRIEFGTDIGSCTGLASQADPGSGVNTAGGVSGANATAPMSSPGRSTSPDLPPSQVSTAKPVAVPASGTYSGTVSADYAQRAATQQRLQEMNARRLRAEAFKGCLAGKGYREFTLTAEQRARLAALEQGSNEHLEFLYRLGTDPTNLAARAPQ